MDRIDWGEFRKGIMETQRYVLSHHPDEEWDCCYAPTIYGRQFHICARCSGIYPGILLGIIAYLSGFLTPLNWLVVLVFPVPALFDWWLSITGLFEGWNPLRTLTGGLLGVAYGLGLGIFLGQGELWILGVGLLYGVTAGSLLYLYRDRLLDNS